MGSNSISGFVLDYDWQRHAAYGVEDFFKRVDSLVERYFYGFHLAIGRRLIEGGFSREELIFLATQEYHYYASTTWWNAGKLLNADTLDQQRSLHGPLTAELGDDLWKADGLSAHVQLFVRYCEGLGLSLKDLERAPLAPGVVLAVSELRRLSATRPVHEFLAASNLVVERMRPRHYSQLLKAFRAHYTWVPESALLFYEVHAHLDGDHESLGRRIVADYMHDRREQDMVFAAVLRSLCLRIAMYESIETALNRGSVGLVPWPNFPREPWPRPGN